jgi:DNA-binding NarL/FixJ family response regulator
MREHWIRVVIVEDEESLLSCLEAEISLSRGLEVVGAFTSFESAFRAFPKLHADVVIMDINLPGKDGIEGCELLKRRWPRVKVLAFSIEDGKRIIDAFAAGVDGYLLKMKTPRAQLVAEIEAVCRGQFPMPAEVREEMVNFLRARSRLFPKLSPTERLILGEIERGLPQKQIAADHQMNLHTVKTHLKRIVEKLGASSSHEAVHLQRIAC